ncbi:MAG: hypothetical protein AAF226_16360 [Verrucomicrobiota bacterium]
MVDYFWNTETSKIELVFIREGIGENAYLVSKGNHIQFKVGDQVYDAKENAVFVDSNGASIQWLTKKTEPQLLKFLSEKSRREIAIFFRTAQILGNAGI